ncbi:hypothetical protein [Kitasatospora paranensis]|uniref:hypothetical protein n=1 Tax=Kitasatospora paranensis TaxID=258053 RepID=UPI0031F0508F
MRRTLERARQEVRRLIAANAPGALHRALGDRDDDSEQHHRPPSPPPSLPTLRAPARAPVPARDRRAQRPVGADRLAA